MSDLRRFLIGCTVFVALLVAAYVIFAWVALHVQVAQPLATLLGDSSWEGVKLNPEIVSSPKWASSAVDAGDLGLARTYADEMLKTGDSDDSHHGHTILGRIALGENDIKEARAQLLASAHVSETPVLASFGPNMMLAKELLNKGESKTVLEYFRLCGSFWAYPDKRPHQELFDWSKEVQAGKTPDFGANLDY